MDYSLLFIKARNPDYNSNKILEELKEESGSSGGQNSNNNKMLVS
jgi:hypothetical protein